MRSPAGKPDPLAQLGVQGSFAVAGLPLTAGQLPPTLGAGVLPAFPGLPSGRRRWPPEGSPRCPPPGPPEFRRRAVELARPRNKPIARTARNLGSPASCLHNRMARAGVDEGWSVSSLRS